jgi:hypothetical protein
MASFGSGSAHTSNTINSTSRVGQPSARSSRLLVTPTCRAGAAYSAEAAAKAGSAKAGRLFPLSYPNFRLPSETSPRGSYPESFRGSWVAQPFLSKSRHPLEREWDNRVE